MDARDAAAVTELVTAQLAEFYEKELAPIKARGVGMDPKEMARETFRVAKELVQRAQAPLLARIAELERAPMKYLGVYEAGRKYERGTFVTNAGSLWHCGAESTKQRPGDGQDWQLAVKSGQHR